MNDGAPLTILVADDNPSARTQIVEILKDVGHETVDVSDGNEAQSALDALRFDLAVLDHDMPGKGGADLARALAGQVPVIGLSSSGVPKSQWDGAGIVGWLQKPIDARLLIRAVQDAISADRPDTRSEAPVDLVHLASYTAGDRELEAELAELFRASCERYFTEMAGCNDDRLWKDAAHGLKGASRGIGANEVARLAAYAETLLGDAMAARRRDVLEQMRQAAIEVSDYFRQHLENEEPPVS